MLALRIRILWHSLRTAPFSRVLALLLAGGVAVLAYRGTLWFLGFLSGYPFAERAVLSRSLEGLFLLLSAAVLLSALPGALAILYGSLDLHLLLAWPIPAGRVFAQKVLETFLATAGLPTLLTLPVLLALGVHYGASPAYYPLAFAAALAVYALPVALGAALALFFLRFAPAGRAKEWAAAGSAVIGGLLVYVLRAARPEAIFRRAFESPEALSAFLAEWARSGPSFLPSTWAARAVLGALSGEVVPAAALLFFLVTFAFAGVAAAAGWAYRAGWVRGLEGTFQERPPAPPAPWEGYRPLFALWLRDLRRFFRDPHQIAQVLLVFVLVLLYLVSLRAMPLEGLLFKRVVGFLHLAFQGFVLVAVGLRLAYPLFGLEGRGYWVVETAPVSRGMLVFSRFGFALFLLLPLALALGLYVPGAIGLEGGLVWVSLASALAVAVGAAGLGVGIGALFPAGEQSGEVALGLGGLLYMTAGLLFAAGVALLDAYPVHRVLSGAGFWAGPESAVWLLALWLLAGAFAFLPLFLAWRLPASPRVG